MRRIRARIDLSETVVQQVRSLCLRLLGQRERSRDELLRILAAEGFETEIARQVVDELAEESAQSNQRYAEVLVRSRMRRGQGPQRLRLELQTKGVGTEDIVAALAEADWEKALADVHTKKFGHGKPKTPKEYAARMRFLAQRGFSQDAIRSLLKQLGADDDFPKTEDD